MTLKDSIRYTIDAYMDKGRNSSYNGGSLDVRPIAGETFEMCEKAIWAMNPNDTEILWSIKGVVEAAQNAAMNTFPGERIVGDDREAVKGLFRELNTLLDDVIISSGHEKRFGSKDGNHVKDVTLDILDKKVGFIAEVLYENQSITRRIYEGSMVVDRGYMIFGEHGTIFNVIHKINTEWSDIVGRGVSLDNFVAYKGKVLWRWSNGIYQSDAEKCEEWFEILDGKKNMLPSKICYYKNIGGILEETIGW